MTKLTNQDRFHALQQRAQQASHAAQEYASDLRVKYGAAYYHGRLGRKEIKRLEQIQRAETRAVDRFFAFLDTIATRPFRSGVPCHWIVEKLTYSDATTMNAMSVVPPPAYGCTQADSQRFAATVRREIHEQANSL